MLSCLRAALGVLLLLICSCSSRSAPTRKSTYRMGERAQVGRLIYIVLDTEWLDRLGDPPNARLPEQRFLTVRVSVTNSGTTLSAVPLLSVSDMSGGRKFSEITDAPAVPEWLGFLRTVKPADTIYGRVVFDVPPAAYQLRISTDAEPENEEFATVDLPLELDRPHLPSPSARQ
jgi:hypothetical protein